MIWLTMKSRMSSWKSEMRAQPPEWKSRRIVSSLLSVTSGRK